MLKFTKFLFLGAVAVSLAACGGLELGKAKGVAPSGSAFDKNLYGEYMTQSQMEYDESDYEDSDTFAVRAMAAASGQATQPEAVEARHLPADKVGDLTAARARLVKALDSGAAEKAAKPAAHAQVMYECWMQEQEENFQPDDIAACRGGFMDAMAQVDAAMKPAPMVAKPAPAPAPQPMVMPGPFVIYFDFDSAELNPVAKSVVSTVVTAVKKSKPETVVVTGFTDRAGSEDYNMALSKKRAAEVAQSLKAAGVTTSIKMIVASYGEMEPQVPTDDGVREAKNRRVTVVLK